MPDRIFAYVTCLNEVSCGSQPLTKAQYDAQMSKPNRLWACPRCGAVADYDDEKSEELQGHYWVEPALTTTECSGCGQQAPLWDIVHEDLTDAGEIELVSEGTSYGNKEHAQELCNIMNGAYNDGVEDTRE